MAVDVTFINAADNAEMDVELDENMTGEQVVQGLIDNQFIPPLNDANQYYTLTIKGRNTITEEQTLGQAGIQPNDTIRVNVAQRGGNKERS